MDSFGGYIPTRPSVTPGSQFGGQYPAFRPTYTVSPGSPFGAQYPNLGLMNLNNVVDQTKVDGVANFIASLKDSSNTLNRVYGNKDSEINFITEEVPFDDLSLIDKIAVKLTGKRYQGQPTNKIAELESDGKVNFVSAQNGGGAYNEIDNMVGGAGSYFTFSQLQNLNNVIDLANVRGVANF